ncbi:hypothetical protein Tchar_02142 [Tepidimonas charontis]|uniref:Uncharacterized protein n=1 Tax=Tepidimonas charontis TaxID=2267262 RepID=A0A554X8U5_9BURK|nr:hypothetical protein Tchar_02142 [Tepidimonas charontis]
MPIPLQSPQVLDGVDDKRGTDGNEQNVGRHPYEVMTGGRIAQATTQLGRYRIDRDTRRQRLPQAP